MSKFIMLITCAFLFNAIGVNPSFSASETNTKVVKVIKIADASESSDSVTTDAGDFLLRATNNNYKKVKKLIKANKGKKIVLFLDADGEIADAKVK